MINRPVLVKSLKRTGLYTTVFNIRHCIQYRGQWLEHPLKNVPDLIRFLIFNKETTNFTYDISNVDELVGFISNNLKTETNKVRSYIEELESDLELRSSLEERLRSRKDRNKRAKYGRRIGWYCTVRIQKPSLIIETGTRDGLGSSILARALYRNQREGHPGRLITFDIDKSAGWLVNPGLGGGVQIVVEDTKTALDKYLHVLKVDFFIHDSDHSYEHETFELETISKCLSKGAVIVSDNAHASSAMKDFCNRHGLEFSFFKERPIRHIYPGAGIGFALWR